MRQAIVFLILAPGLVLAQDMPLSQVLLPGETWKEVPGLRQTVGLVAGTGNTIFALDQSGVLQRIASDLSVVPADKASGPCINLVRDRAGNPVAILAGSGGAEVLGPKGAERKLLAGKQIADLLETPAGQVYYTLVAGKAIFEASKDAPVADGLLSPRGLVLWLDGGTLVAGESGGAHLCAFRVTREGNLDARERYYSLRTRKDQPSEVRALILDSDQRMYAATREGVQIFDPTGRLCGVLTRPVHQPVTALALTSEAPQRLFVVCDGKVFYRNVKTRSKAFLRARP